jgi:hypothetical protein
LVQVAAPNQATVRAEVVGRHVSQHDRQHLVAELDTAEVALCSVPPPAPDPEASAMERLGLLIDAEGVLSAEAAGLSQSALKKSLATASISLQTIGAWLRSAA